MEIETFNGLTNTSDTLAAGHSWLKVANNVDITPAAKIKRRDGYTLAASGSFSSAYATRDFQRLYAIDGETLKVATGYAGDALQFTVIATGIDDAPLHAAEANEDVYFIAGDSSGIIGRDHALRDWAWPEPTPVSLRAVTGSLPVGPYQVTTTYLLPDGRETGAGEIVTLALGAGEALQITSIPQVPGLRTRVYIAPAGSTELGFAFETAQSAATWNTGANSIGEPLATANLKPLPAGATRPVLWQGRMHVAQYFAQGDLTAIWASEPLGFHLFDLLASPIFVPGRVTMLAAVDAALLIGTEATVYALSNGVLAELAPYGAVDGWPAVFDDDTRTVLFWTTRGLCRALPFSNLTERAYSPRPGVRVGAALVRTGGGKRFLASLHAGGDAFNPH